MSSELVKRVAFAVVAAPLAIAIIIAGGLPLAILLSAVAGIGSWELFRIARAGGVEPFDGAGIALAAAIPLLAHAHRAAQEASSAVDGGGSLDAAAARVGLAFTGVSALAAAYFVLVMLSLLATAIWARGTGGRPLTAAAVTLFGALYTGATLAFGYAIRYHGYAVGRGAGAALVALPLLLTWASDIGAYFVGRAVGRHKLIPSVSPGKTVEGSIGGLVATVVVCWLYVRFALRPYAQLAMTPVAIVAFAALVSAAAQVGDLAESLLKREAGVKDSSHLIPGHGGVLDRFDSLFFVLPLAYVLLDWLLIPAPV